MRCQGQPIALRRVGAQPQAHRLSHRLSHCVVWGRNPAALRRVGAQPH